VALQREDFAERVVDDLFRLDCDVVFWFCRVLWLSQRGDRNT